MTLEEIKKALGPDTKWDAFESSISRNFKFENKNEAHEFMARVGEVSERYHNKSDLFVQSYNNIKVLLTTEAISDVTMQDIEISRRIDEIYDDIVSKRG